MPIALAKLTAPPVAVLLSPALIVTPPATAPLDVSPTSMMMSPPSPPVEAPVTIDIAPEAPDVVTPVINVKLPLTPLVPELAVRMTIAPLDLAVPVPEVNDM